MQGKHGVTPSGKQIYFNEDSFTAKNVNDAIVEAKQNAEGFPRAGARSVYNGTVSNNSWLGPNELLPNTPLLVVPVKTKINEISWANQSTNVAFTIQFREGSRTGNIFYQLVVTSPNPGYGFVSGVDYTINAGTAIHAQYIDQGTNLSDADLVLWISRVPE